MNVVSETEEKEEKTREKGRKCVFVCGKSAREKMLRMYRKN